jgi:DNA polymerase-1
LSKNKNEKSAADRIAVNTPIQGSAADIVKIAMIRLKNRLKDTDCKMLLQVHDELIFECEKERVEEYSQIIKEEMENVISLSVPLKVSVECGDNWGDFH